MNRTWGPLVPAVGLAPIGEIETRCPGCRSRFISGQLVMQRMEGVVGLALWAHLECTDRVEELERAS